MNKIPLYNQKATMERKELRVRRILDTTASKLIHSAKVYLPQFGDEPSIRTVKRQFQESGIDVYDRIAFVNGLVVNYPYLRDIPEWIDYKDALYFVLMRDPNIFPYG